MNNAGYKLTLVLVLVASFTVTFAQDDYEPRYLLENKMGKVHVSGFGSYIIGFSDVGGSFAVYNGGGGAVLLNQTVYLGGYGMGLSTSHKYDPVTILKDDNSLSEISDLYTSFGHGGFWLGYLHKSYKPVHFGVSTKLGWGSIDLREKRTYTDNPDVDYNYFLSDHVFVMTPQLEVEMNLLRWFKMSASAGYQLVSGIDQTYINASGQETDFFSGNDFNSPMFNLTFSFGGFGGAR
ncbi:MAG: hypothetical protein KDC05_02750 [Bacteroidales bacterium]|nr:hypothetical protein [Bacteroidales bacterium]